MFVHFVPLLRLIFQNSKDDDRSLALLDSTPPPTPRALRLDRMTLTHPGAMLDDPREFRRYYNSNTFCYQHIYTQFNDIN